MLSCLHPRVPKEDVDVILEKRKTLWAADAPSDAAEVLRSIGLHRLANTVLASHLSGGALARLIDNIPAEHFLDDQDKLKREENKSIALEGVKNEKDFESGMIVNNNGAPPVSLHDYKLVDMGPAVYNAQQRHTPEVEEDIVNMIQSSPVYLDEYNSHKPCSLHLHHEDPATANGEQFSTKIGVQRLDLVPLSIPSSNGPDMGNRGVNTLNALDYRTIADNKKNVMNVPVKPVRNAKPLGQNRRTQSADSKSCVVKSTSPYEQTVMSAHNNFQNVLHPAPKGVSNSLNSKLSTDLQANEHRQLLVSTRDAGDGITMKAPPVHASAEVTSKEIGNFSIFDSPHMVAATDTQFSVPKPMSTSMSTSMPSSSWNLSNSSQTSQKDKREKNKKDQQYEASTIMQWQQANRQGYANSNLHTAKLEQENLDRAQGLNPMLSISDHNSPMTDDNSNFAQEASTAGNVPSLPHGRVDHAILRAPSLNCSRAPSLFGGATTQSDLCQKQQLVNLATPGVCQEHLSQTTMGKETHKSQFEAVRRRFSNLSLPQDLHPSLSNPLSKQSQSANPSTFMSSSHDPHIPPRHKPSVSSPSTSHTLRPNNPNSNLYVSKGNAFILGDYASSPEDTVEGRECEPSRAIGGQSHATLSDLSTSAGQSARKNDVGRFRNLFSDYTPASGLVPPHTNAFPSANRNTALVSKSNSDTWGFGGIETGDGVFGFKSASSLPSPPATHLCNFSNEVECLHDIASSTGASNGIASSTFSSHGMASSAGVLGANKSDRVQPWQMRNRHSTHSQEQSLRISQSPVHGFDFNSSGNTSGVVTQHSMKQKEKIVLWLRYWDGEERKHYYYNTATEETAWVLPAGAIFEDGDEESKREALAASSNPPLPSSAPSDSLRKVVIPPFIPKLWHEGHTPRPASSSVDVNGALHYKVAKGGDDPSEYSSSDEDTSSYMSYCKA